MDLGLNATDRIGKSKTILTKMVLNNNQIMVLVLSCNLLSVRNLKISTSLIF